MTSEHRLLGRQYGGIESLGTPPWEQTLPVESQHLGHHLAMLIINQLRVPRSFQAAPAARPSLSPL